MGNFICKTCNKFYTTYDEAVDCAESHVDQPTTTVKSTATVSVTGISNELIANGSTMDMHEKLCRCLIDDYMCSRKIDVDTTGRVGPLTLALSKQAVESLCNYNKLVYGEKTSKVSVSVDGNKLSDLDALKDLVSKKSKLPQQ